MRNPEDVTGRDVLARIPERRGRRQGERIQRPHTQRRDDGRQVGRPILIYWRNDFVCALHSLCCQRFGAIRYWAIGLLGYWANGKPTQQPSSPAASERSEEPSPLEHADLKTNHDK